MSGHRGYGSTEVDKLSCDSLHSLIPEEERRSNGHSKDGDCREDANTRSEPDSPSSPGWGDGPRSPVLDLRSFHGVVEEGVLVNVTGSPSDELEGLGCFPFEENGDDTDGDVEELHSHSEEFASAKPVHEELPKAEQLEKRCSEDELTPEKGFDDELPRRSNVDCSELSRNEENTSKPFSPELRNHKNQMLSDDDDPDSKSVSDTELANILKSISSDEEKV